MADLARKRKLAGGQDSNRLHRATRNGAWLRAVPPRLNGTELSQEELWYNIRLRYGLIPQDILATCNGCGKNFSIDHAPSCPKGGLVLARHDDAAKEWGFLGSWSLVPSAITYEPKINSRTVQGGRTRAGARQEGGEADGGADIVEESQGGIGPTVNEADRLVGRPVQVQVHADSRVDVSAHGFWKRGTTSMFDIRIFNLDAGSYLRMTPEKALSKAEKEKEDLYLQACLEHRRTFTHMVYSADLIPRAEALAAQKRLSALLRYKLKREYSEICGFVRARISLAIVRSNSLILRGNCDKGARIRQPPELTDGAVMALRVPLRG